MENGDKKRTRTFIACERCKKKKRKCDGGHPCHGCFLAKTGCDYIPRDRTTVSDSLLSSTVHSLQREILELRTNNEDLRNQLSNAQSQQLNVAQSPPSRYPRYQNSPLTTNTPSINFLIESTFQDGPKDSVASHVSEPRSESSTLSETVFTEVLSNLMFKTTNESQEYIGTFAVISIVKSIKKVLLGGDYEESPPIISEEHIDDEEMIPKRIEQEFLNKFFSMAHNRGYFVDQIWFKKVIDKAPESRDEWENFTVNIALAIGCRLTELLKVSTFPHPELYFRRALKNLSGVEMHPLRQIQASLLMAVFISRSYYLSFYVSAWDLIGSAMRKLVQFGYHRKQAITRDNCWTYEFIKRLFWSAYNYDKLLSLSLGRPSSIIDNFIDIPFPVGFDIPETPSPQDFDRLYELQVKQEADPNADQPISSLTTIVATTKIRMIESRIHLLLYSSNNVIPIADTFESLEAELDSWYSRLPSRESFDSVMRGKESYDFLDLSYYRARLILLLPTIMNRTNPRRDSSLDQACLAAGRICSSYRKLHRDSILEFSIIALHTVFLAGITMIYYVNYKGEPEFSNIRNDLRACSSLLYVFSERWKESKTYSDIFDRILDEMDTRERSSPKTKGNMNYLLKTLDVSNTDFWDQILENIQSNGV